MQNSPEAYFRQCGFGKWQRAGAIIEAMIFVLSMATIIWMTK